MVLSIDSRVSDAVKYAVSRIENQHIIVFSATLSIAVAFVLASEGPKTVAEISCETLLCVILKIIKAFLWLLCESFLVFLPTFALATIVYILLRGEYSATIILTLDVSGIKIIDKDWRNVVKEVLEPSIPELEKKYRLWHVERRGCSTHEEQNQKFLLCKHSYVNPLRVKLLAIKLKSLAFKLEGQETVILTITFTANPFRVLLFELLGGWMVEQLMKLVNKVRKHTGIEVDPWFDVAEGLTLFLDEVIKQLESRGATFAGII
jgi:hypothetical protein